MRFKESAECIVDVINEISQQDLRKEDFLITRVGITDMAKGIGEEALSWLQFDSKAMELVEKFIQCKCRTTDVN